MQGRIFPKTGWGLSGNRGKPAPNMDGYIFVPSDRRPVARPETGGCPEPAIFTGLKLF
jgi:hypothetical protein